MQELQTNRILFIHPRRGLFQLTQCGECGYNFGCENCDANLVTYKTWERNMELVCHQCQSYYNYPLDCPECHSLKLKSKVGGIDELENQLKTSFGVSEVVRLDKKSTYNPALQLALTTRIFDPGIDYSAFHKIVFINAQNLLASADYLVFEDTTKALAELLKSTTANQQLIFDSRVESDLFDGLLKLNQPEYTLYDWYNVFLTHENINREQFKFPPYYNLILLTTQHKNRDQAWNSANELYSSLKTQLIQHSTISLTAPYQAKFLRRKGLYSYHVLLKYPKAYQRFFELRDIIHSLSDPYSTQIRLNPKHIF
jgi:primosomal protein N' (replication factor Y) (superfamily II helicase)